MIIMGRKAVIHQLPNFEPYVHLKHKPLPYCSLYQMYETGQLYSRRSGHFMKQVIWKHKNDVIGWTIKNEKGKMNSFSRDLVLKKLFNPIPQFEGIRTAVLDGFSNYIFYSDGRIFSLKSWSFLKKCNINKFDGYCLLKDNGQKKTVYIQKILKELF